MTINRAKISNWHNTKPGLLVFGLVELGLSYGFFSWAVDNGKLQAWALAFVFFIGAAQNGFRFMRKVVRND